MSWEPVIPRMARRLAPIVPSSLFLPFPHSLHSALLIKVSLFETGTACIALVSREYYPSISLLILIKAGQEQSTCSDVSFFLSKNWHSGNGLRPIFYLGYLWLPCPVRSWVLTITSAHPRPRIILALSPLRTDPIRDFAWRYPSTPPQ